MPLRKQNFSTKICSEANDRATSGSTASNVLIKIWLLMPDNELQELAGKAASKKQQKEPQTGSGASRDDAADGNAADGNAAEQQPAEQPAGEQPGSEVAYPDDKSKDETGAAPAMSQSAGFSEAVGHKDAVAGSSSGGGGTTGSSDAAAAAAAGKLPGSVPVTTALKTGISRLLVGCAAKQDNAYVADGKISVLGWPNTGMAQHSR